MARGLAADAARAEARREFGNVAGIQEEARDVPRSVGRRTLLRARSRSRSGVHDLGGARAGAWHWHLVAGASRGGDRSSRGDATRLTQGRALQAPPNEPTPPPSRRVVRLDDPFHDVLERGTMVVVLPRSRLVERGLDQHECPFGGLAERTKECRIAGYARAQGGTRLFLCRGCLAMTRECRVCARAGRDV